MHQTNYHCHLIAGNDAKTFLQGQFSCDLEEVTKNPKAGAYCLPDGKVIAFFYLCQIEQGYLLITSDDNAEAFLKRLRMFVLRADVQIKPIDYAVLGYLKEQEVPIETAQNLSINLNQNLCVYIDISGSYSAQKDTALSVEQWNYLETLNGVPTLTDELRGKFILPFLNLDWLGAVSYQKGCYVGQEIIARLHYRSTPAKRSFIYTCNEELSDLKLSVPSACVDGDNKPCRVTPVRICRWQNSTALILEMATRNAPRQTLILNHNHKTYNLLCASQPYQTQ
jgi:folate-binding protein YgfZ